MPTKVTSNTANCLVVCFAFCLIIALIFSSSSCNQKQPDTTANTANNTNSSQIKIKRFEQALFTVDTSAGNYVPSVKALIQQYPDIFPLFSEQIMQWGGINDPGENYLYALKGFISNSDVRGLYQTTQEKFPNLSQLEAELTAAFANYQRLFPNRSIPKQVFSHISTFGPAVLTVDSAMLGINLDMFLGRNFDIYRMREVNIPEYLSRRAEPPYITPMAMQAYLQGIFPIAPSEKDKSSLKLIDYMVYQGKILYLLDAVLPKTPDTLKIGYTAQQLEWCQQEEANIWTFFIDKELLFNANYHDFFKFVNEAPTTNEMPPQSPGKISAWVGWQIIKAYLKQNPNAANNLSELMRLHNNGQQILTESKYKPKLE
jgi:hypothetical protein